MYLLKVKLVSKRKEESVKNNELRCWSLGAHKVINKCYVCTIPDNLTAGPKTKHRATVHIST